MAALLKQESFSLQGNAKTLEGARHADRDAQFRYINAQARDHMNAGEPVISVDAKKKGAPRGAGVSDGGERPSIALPS